jgi:outer membrane murein-binding lipoprotein Lpp
MTRAYSTLISAVPLQGADMASMFVTWPRALGIASFSVMVATGINAAMCTVISKDVVTLKADVEHLKEDFKDLKEDFKDLRGEFKELRAEVKSDIKDLRDDMREIRVMLSRRWF